MLTALFKLDFVWASDITLHSVGAACSRSASVALVILDPRNERSEGISENRSAEGTLPSGPGVLFDALRGKLSKKFLSQYGMINSKFSKCTSYWFMVSFSYSKSTVVLCF